MLDPGVLLEPALDVVLELCHLCTYVDPPLDVEQQQLNNTLPLGIGPPSLHLLRLDLVSDQEGRVHNCVGHPLECRLEALFLSDGVLALADRGEEELEAGALEGGVEGLAAEVDVC